MSSGSSSGGSSPVRFRPESPGSDAVSSVPSSWQPSSTPFHPSAAVQASQSNNAPVLRQPVGFGTSPPSVPTYQAPPPEPSAVAQLALPGQSAPAAPSPNPPEKSAKNKGKGKGKSKGKDTSKGKTNTSPRKAKEASADEDYSYPIPIQSIQRTAFRVCKYKNDPNAVASPYYGAQDGPYGSTYRVTLGDNTKPKNTKLSKKAQLQAQVELAHSLPPSKEAPPDYYTPLQDTSYHGSSPSSLRNLNDKDLRPRPSYYRWNYDEDRPLVDLSPETVPATFQPPAPAPAPAPPPPQTEPQPQPQTQYRYPPHIPPTQAEPRPNTSRSSKRDDRPTQSTAHNPPPQPDYYDNDDSSPSPPDDYYASPSPPPPTSYLLYPPPRPPPTHPSPQPSHAYSSSSRHAPEHSPPSSHSSEPRRKSKSRPHRHEQAQQSQAPPQQPTGAPAPAVQGVPPPAVRVCRVLTLLIEDKRNPDDEQMLAEVRVPLKQADAGEEGFWADAQEVSQELQKGPSRIDGAAKVYTMRGKYKQYFLRISADGETDSQSANLKVSTDRTLEIFVEHNRRQGEKPLHTLLNATPPRPQREPLPPVTERISSPPPAPVHSPPKRSSLFSISDASSPVDDRFGTRARAPSTTSESSRKRQRSASVQSIQSTFSESYSMRPQEHSAASPYTLPSPSVRTSSTAPSRTSSRTSAYSHSDTRHAPMSPSSPPSPDIPSRLPFSAPTPFSQPLRQLSGPGFHPGHSAPLPSPAQASSPFTSVQSPPKRAKLAVPEDHHRSRDPQPVSPGPSPSSAYSWSSSRAPSWGESSTPSFSSSKTSSKAPPPPARANPFEQYGSPFGFHSRHQDTSRSGASQSNRITLPSIPSLSTVSSTHPAPTTLAPSATSLAPSLSGVTTTGLDNAVGQWIRGIISKEAAWDTFVRNRTRLLKMAEQLEQYRYVQRVIDRFAGTRTPVDLEGAGGVLITKAQVMRAFNLSLSWGDDCTETLVLSTLYGPGGTRHADARVCAMLEETPPITTGMQAKKYLTLLREVHGQWTIAHPDGS